MDRKRHILIWNTLIVGKQIFLNGRGSDSIEWESVRCKSLREAQKSAVGRSPWSHSP